MGKKILITGGAGFIGSNLADHYLAKGEEVTIYDNLSRREVMKNLQWLKKKYPKMIFTKADVRDFEKLKKATKGKDLVYHLAAQVAVTTSVVKPRLDFEVNALGTLNVLEAARVQKNLPIVLYASTNKVYGGLEDVQLVEREKRYEFKDEVLSGISEDHRTDFHSPYGCSKGAGDQYVHDYARIYGLPTVVFRQSCIYGKRQFGNEDQGWVAHFFLKALKGKSLNIYGDGKQVRDILYIDDLVDCYLKAIKKIDKTAGKIYNIGGGKRHAVSLWELIAILERKLGITLKLRFKNWRPGDQKVYISNIAKANKDFAWKPKTSIPSGVDKLLAWLKTI